MRCWVANVRISKASPYNQINVLLLSMMYVCFLDLQLYNRCIIITTQVSQYFIIILLCMLSYLPMIMLNIGIHQSRYIVYNTATMKGLLQCVT